MLDYRLLLSGLLGLLAVAPARASVRLPALVGDHMVLQRATTVPIWGWAEAREQVAVAFRGKVYAAVPDASGRWQVLLPAMPAGGPYTMTIKGQNAFTINDILVGDVWLASGQSNMEMPVRDPRKADAYPQVLNADQEVAAADFPQIREFGVRHQVAYQPQPEGDGDGWQVCGPGTVSGFSAVGYFFARDLYQRYQVPIGIIKCAWGGTPAEAWASGPALKPFPQFQAQVADFAQRPRQPTLEQQLKAYDARQQELQRNIRAYDKGYLPGGKTWADADFDATAWPAMTLPAIWETVPGLSTYDGVVWFRKEITLSASEAAQPVTLSLGPVDDADTTYFNGVKVGSTTGYNAPRNYAIPAALVKAGRNVIAVRVLDTGGGGGIWGPPATLFLQAGPQTRSLAGPWQYHLGLETKDLPQMPIAGGAQNAPTTLFNGMVAPLRPYALKGVIWYQGEANAGRAAQYRTLFPALIADWRRQWGQQLPFLFVQLANFMASAPQPAQSDWAELREAQARTLALPRTGMAVAIDVGDSADIHPANKQAVGQRLALAARQVAYGDKNVVAAGPTFQRMAVEGSRVRLTFGHVGAGPVVKEGTGPIRGFAVAGADQKFYWATATQQGPDLLVSSADVPAPVAVRYDWANNPHGNLCNRDGLPAVPFRTDSWPGTTGEKK